MWGLFIDVSMKMYLECHDSDKLLRCCSSREGLQKRGVDSWVYIDLPPESAISDPSDIQIADEQLTRSGDERCHTDTGAQSAPGYSRARDNKTHLLDES